MRIWSASRAAIFMVALCATKAAAQDDDQARIVAAVRSVSPSVVALNVTINGERLLPKDPLAKLIGRVDSSLLNQIEEQASGSGFVLDRTGLIVTNSHVVHGASDIEVVFNDGARVKGTFVAEDTKADIALVRVANYAKLPRPLVLGTSSAVQQGEWAIAFGEPFALQQSVSVGVVSGFRRTEAIETEDGQVHEFNGLMQVSAPINPGNSGGPLTDFNGRVIGINQSAASPTSGAQGIGFAIPIDAVKSTVASLKRASH